MKNNVLLVSVLVFSHLLALWIGSSMQHRAQGDNAHAHLSDVGDAITLGKYFAGDAADAEEHWMPARATAGIIHRILISSTPGPNSKTQLEGLRTALYTKYPGPARQPAETAAN